MAFALQLRKKHGRISVRVVEKCQFGTIQCVDMAVLRVARTSRRSRFHCFRGPGSTLGQRGCLPNYSTKEFPTSANFESNLSEI